MAAVSGTPDEIAQQLVRILRAELALYREMLGLSQQQKEHIEQNDSERLLRIITEKQSRIGKISALESEAAPLKARRDAELESWPQSARDLVDPLIIELQAVLTDIVTLEDEGRSAAEMLSKTSSKKVEKIQKGKAMLNAYGKVNKNVNIARYKDKHG